MIRLSAISLATLIVMNLSAQQNASDAAASDSTMDNVQIVDNSLRPEYKRAKQVYAHLISATYLRVTTKLFPAKKGYQRILREHEASTFVHTQLASLSMEVFDLPTAEQHCRRAIEIDPEKPMPYYLLGQIMIWRYGDAKHKDRWSDIVSTFQKVVELDPDHYGFEKNGRPFSAYIYLGEIAEQMGRLRVCLQRFQRVDSYHALSADILFTVG